LRPRRARGVVQTSREEDPDTPSKHNEKGQSSIRGQREKRKTHNTSIGRPRNDLSFSFDFFGEKAASDQGGDTEIGS
jgi:hypothetical protein